ncbi:hypothetical protein MFB89_002078 [Klebsiella pneumoniae]|nr:hypothetical protein [Klebsiella pneumoniae]
MAVHLLIVDALNLIRRIHAVQGSPCVDTCLHALEQLADYWGLAGISSSKVPGVAGIGPKSAAQLLNEFQDLEGLYARLAEVPEKWRKKLAAHQEMAFTCREVARLQTDLQLDGNLQQLRLTR